VAEPLQLAAGIFEDTFDVLRGCGGGLAQCVTYWLGPVADPLVDRVVHPDHAATRVSYEVDGAWLTRFFAGNRSAGRRIRLQVHTHPGRALHSMTDDLFCILPVSGFLSLVIPRFAAGPVGFEGSFLAEMQADGSWTERDPTEVFQP